MGAGALVVVSALFKYQGAAIAAPLALLAFYDRRPAGHRPDEPRVGQSLARLAAAAFGGLVVLAVFVGLYWRQGELPALVFWAWTYPLRYAGSLAAATFAFNAAKMTGLWLLVSAGPLALVVAGWGVVHAATREAAEAAVNDVSEAGGASARASAAVPLRALAIVWAAGAVLGIASGGRFFLHYYLQLLPPLALVAGIGLERLIGSGSAGAKRLLVVAAAVTGGTLAVTWGLNAADFRLHRDRARHDAIYREVGAFVRSHSEPGDRILVWGNSPEIYYYADRSMGTRFPFCNYQSGKIWGTAADEPGATIDSSQVLEPAWQMLLSDMERRQPAFVVDAAAAGLDRWEGHAIGRYPRLAAIIEAQYRPVAVVNRVVVYARRDVLAITAPAAERGAPR